MQIAGSPSLTEPAQRARTGPEFPGCRPITIRRGEVGTWDERFEFWDAATETAWVVRDVSAAHEFPSQLLSALGHMIASARGSPIICLGSMDLELRGEDGERRRIMQADQSVYLHPERSRLPDRGMILGEHDTPDVVLEVDFTTDVRRGKLGLYEEWGFPEIWVEVPNRYSPSRPARRPTGVTIHLLEGGAYRTAPESRAFPGWTAEEIHTALNEPTVSEDTVRVLRRVGRTLGVREGTGPDDMPWLRSYREEARAEARAGTMAAIAGTILASRGMPRLASPLLAEELAGIADEEAVEAMLHCKDEADLRARLQALRRRLDPS